MSKLGKSLAAEENFQKFKLRCAKKKKDYLINSYTSENLGERFTDCIKLVISVFN